MNVTWPENTFAYSNKTGILLAIFNASESQAGTMQMMRRGRDGQNSL